MTALRTLTRTLILAIIAYIILSGSAFGEGKDSLYSSQNPTIATIGLKDLSLQEIEDKEINELRVKLYDLLNHKLISTTIKKLAKSNPKYAKKPTLDIKDKDIKEFYTSNNVRGDYVALYPRIKQHLEQQILDKHDELLYQEALREGIVKSYLMEPNDFLVSVPVETAYLRGDNRARVFLMEFSDYQCPFCSRVQPTIDQLRTMYEGRVQFGYRHMPLPFHQEADEAAIAVECARDQEKFETYHHLLFQNQNNQHISDLKEYATKADIKDLKRFNDCLDKETYRDRVNNDQKAASEAGVSGAPGFVIGLYDRRSGLVRGEIVSGAMPLSSFTKTIDKYLAK
ncbi:DsbA family protein [bacterium]|nr:DsbA family protein [bacterium]